MSKQRIYELEVALRRLWRMSDDIAMFIPERPEWEALLVDEVKKELCHELALEIEKTRNQEHSHG